MPIIKDYKKKLKEVINTKNFLYNKLKLKKSWFNNSFDIDKILPLIIK